MAHETRAYSYNPGTRSLFVLNRSEEKLKEWLQEGLPGDGHIRREIIAQHLVGKDTKTENTVESDGALWLDRRLHTLSKMPSLQIRSKDKQSRSILGFDIYEYSQYTPNAQVLIPIIFDIIFDHAAQLCKRYEPLFFEEHEFRENFEHTGDGGYIVFEHPVQSIVYATYFHSILRLINAGKLFQKINMSVGEIVLRSAISYDHMYRYKPYHLNKPRWFGSAFVTAGRMLSKDRLNRCLIDQNTFEWFLNTTNGVESLSTVDVDTMGRLLKKNPHETDYDSYLFSTDNRQRGAKGYNHIRSCHVQKIGTIPIKKNQFSIYNIELQCRIWPSMMKEMLGPHSDSHDFDSIGDVEQPMLISVGNLNTSGIG